MRSPATDLVSSLVTGSIGTFAAETGWAIYVNREPENPDTTVTLYDTVGSPFDGLCVATRNESFRIQVRIRANTYLTAYSKAVEVQSVLDYIANETIDTAYYNVVHRLDLISSLGQDDKDRCILVQNYAGLRSST